MIQSDLRKQNFTVDQSVLVRGETFATKTDVIDLAVQTLTFPDTSNIIGNSLILNNIIVSESDLSTLTISESLTLNELIATTALITTLTTTVLNATTATITNLTTTSLSTGQMNISGSSTNTNILFTSNAAAVTANQLAVFDTNSQTSVTPTNSSTVFPATLISSVTWQSFFGDGSEGDVTIAAPTSLVADRYFNTLTINSTLTPQGNIIYCKTSCIINVGGSVVANGSNTGAQAGGAGAVSVGVMPAGRSGTNGGNENQNGQTTTIAVGTNFGGTGGTGGLAGGFTGGTNNITTQLWINKTTIISHPNFISLLQFNNATAQVLGGFPGLGGGGGAGLFPLGAGGGGGGGGGWIVIVSPLITNNAGGVVFVANGGNGANSGSGGGGSGGGGVVYLITQSTNVVAGMAQVNPGVRGTGGTDNGQNGVAGTIKILTI